MPRIKLTLEQLKKAKPLPHALDPEWSPDPETFLWIMEHVNKWRPKRVNGLHGKLIEPIPYKEDLTYDAITYTDNDIFLVDFITHAILHEANGQKTAEEIAIQIANDFVEAIRRANPKESIVKAVEKGEYTEDVEALFFTIYKQMAMLKKEGLIQ